MKKEFSWNRELSAYLGKNSKSELAILLFIVIFLCANFLLYLKEQSLEESHQRVQALAEQSALQDEYRTISDRSLWIPAENLGAHLEAATGTRFESIRISGNVMTIAFSGYELAELEEELRQLQARYDDMVIERIEQQGEEILVRVEVRL